MTKDADGAVMICYRVIDLPIPFVEARIAHCTACGERVWLADKQPAFTRLLCLQCGVAEIKALPRDENIEIGITEDQRAEIERWLAARDAKRTKQ